MTYAMYEYLLRGEAAVIRRFLGRVGRGGWLRQGVVLAGMLLIVGLALHPASSSSPRPTAVGPGIGELAPPIHLPDLQGRFRNLRQWRGHTTVLLFLASWCEGCRTELPGLVRALPLFQAHGVQLVGVDAVGESPNTVRHFARTYRLAFPILLDASTAAMAAFAVQALPTAIILNHEGRILAHDEAPVDATTLLQVITAGRKKEN